MRILSIFLLIGVIFAPGSGVRAEPVNGIAVIVNDAIITRQDVNDAVASEIELLMRQYGAKPQVLEQKVGELERDRTEILVEQELILHDFKTAGYNLPESIIDEEIQDRIRKRYGDQITLTKSLQAEGITKEAFRQRVRRQIIIMILRQKNVSSALIISPHKIETYYVQHRDDFKVEDRVKLRMIVLNRASSDDAGATKKRAQEILAKVKEGASFAEMATIHSEGSQSKQGGDWGWAERSTLFRGLSQVAFELDAGQVSGVLGRAGSGKDYWFYRYTDAGQLATAQHFVLEENSNKEKLIEEKQFSNGTNSTEVTPQPEEFYLLFVEGKNLSHTKTLGEVRDEIEKNLLVQEQARLQKKWIDRLKTKSFVRYF